MIWSEIEQNISASLDQDFHVKSHSTVSGGDINQAYLIEGLIKNNEQARFFIKLNQISRLDMFQAEAAGLQEIERSQTMRVPAVICSGIAEQQSYLVLESLSLSVAQAGSAVQLGQQLAQMHKNTVANKFGWSQDNTIGSTPQINAQTDSWLDFWREHRLGFQLDLAKQNGAVPSLLSKGDKLLRSLSLFFNDYQPQASLLHGDLWSGNYGYLESGEAVIFDPAVYYGDREADIAMTELFGGFPTEFYRAYNEILPLDAGYKKRKVLYNLYHVLNHFNLFGGGYATQAERMLVELLG